MHSRIGDAWLVNFYPPLLFPHSSLCIDILEYSTASSIDTTLPKLLDSYNTAPSPIYTCRCRPRQPLSDSSKNVVVPD